MSTCLSIMDPFLLFLSLILPIILTLPLIFHFFNHTKPTNPNLPPGSFGWPIIGETLAFITENHDKFIRDRMEKYSPKIFKTKVLGEPTAVLCGVAGHKFIAANEGRLFAAWRPHSTQRLFRSSYQKAASDLIPKQTEAHIYKAPAFLRVEALVKYVEITDSLVAQHFDTYWSEKQEVEIHGLAQTLTLTEVGKFFWGLEDRIRIEKLSKLMDTMMSALHVFPVNLPGTVFYRAMKAAEAMRKEILGLIKEKKAAMSAGVKMKDILAFMIANPDPSTGKFMPENEVADKVMGVGSAAFNSPSMAIAFIVKYLGQRPDVYDKVRREQLEIASSKGPGEALNWEDLMKMKYSWNVALEAMRLTPPLQGTFREATTDISYEGYTIPKGWKLYWTVSTTNMNPEYFPEPEEFDPTRYEKSPPPPYTNNPFGSGPRICPGKDFGRLQILTFLHHLVRRFKWELVNPNFKFLGGMNPIPIEGLRVRLQPL